MKLQRCATKLQVKETTSRNIDIQIGYFAKKCTFNCRIGNKDEMRVSAMRIASMFGRATIKFSPKQGAFQSI
ncbi:hypothetical protein T01_3098 [Trichinella spiralis]|uniref:Uncharacterized protein n=1 Tax=Trichinella spiralis TaxID=6334 RepID=A0A0V1BIL6_TRISP|nr:hypothetical protein T01_3098 [Trichinella spiralis]